MSNCTKQNTPNDNDLQIFFIIYILSLNATHKNNYKMKIGFKLQMQNHTNVMKQFQAHF